jgi:PD-(D/E)XK nuclease superfamily
MLHETTPTEIKNSIDPRILNLSYSSLLTLHSCPRKLQLQRLNSIQESTESQSESITFSFGHTVGLGIQLILERKSWEEIYWRLFLEWKPELFAENIKQNKSFSHAIFAVQKFRALLNSDYLDGYELVTYKDKPACELSFLISLPNGFKYRGFVDAVLRHKISGKIVVLEVKTSSAATVNPATYKNSAQAIGYSIVLDTLFPTLSSYEVQYLVYSTKQYQYDSLQFTKSYVQRARWIRELILDIEIISMYEANDLYPMRGESCYSFFRECEYLGLCQMDTAKLTSPLTAEMETSMLKKESEYQIQITLDDLIKSQIQIS